MTVVNMDPVMHDIQAYETSQLGARVLFNVPLPMNPQHPRNFKDRSDAALYHKHMAGPPMKQLVNLSKGRRIFVMQCGFHAYMESWGLAVTNPYFAKTDEQGRFTMADVPPGTYKLVVWHPYVRSAIEQTVTIGPKGQRRSHYRGSGPDRAALCQRSDGSSVCPLQRDRRNAERNRSDDRETGPVKDG